MGEVKNMFDLNKLHLEDELNEDDSETTTRLIGSMILGRSITDEKFRDRLNKVSYDLTFNAIDEIMRKEIQHEKDKN